MASPDAVLLAAVTCSPFCVRLLYSRFVGQGDSRLVTRVESTGEAMLQFNIATNGETRSPLVVIFFRAYRTDHPSKCPLARLRRIPHDSSYPHALPLLLPPRH